MGDCLLIGTARAIDLGDDQFVRNATLVYHYQCVQCPQIRRRVREGEFVFD